MPGTIHRGADLDATSDAIDNGPSCHRHDGPIANPRVSVNVIKGKLWNERSEFDETKDKTQFRDYESACDRVKAFYKEQHGMSTPTIFSSNIVTDHSIFRKANCCIQHQSPCRLQDEEESSYGRLGGHGNARHTDR